MRRFEWFVKCLGVKFFANEKDGFADGKRISFLRIFAWRESRSPLPGATGIAGDLVEYCGRVSGQFSDRSSGQETCGRRGGRVGRPDHNTELRPQAHFGDSGESHYRTLLLHFWGFWRIPLPQDPFTLPGVLANPTTTGVVAVTGTITLSTTHDILQPQPQPLATHSNSMTTPW